MAQTSKSYRMLENSERAIVPGATQVGSADPKEKITVSVRVRRRQDGPALASMNALAATPHSKRKHMSREEYAANYGAAPTDLDKVAAFAKANGLAVVESSIPRRTVVLSGTIAQINAAFAVDLKHFHTGAETYRSYEGKVAVPGDIADIVESVHGFDNRQMASPMFRASATGQATTPLTPPQVAKLYNFPANSAAGQTIAILEFGGGYKPSDITDYFNNTVHMPVPTVTWVGVDGATNHFTGGGDDTEVILDIDVAGSVAPGAKIVVYFAPNTTQGWIDAITTAAHDATNRPSVISISWAGGESGWGSAIHNVSTALQEAAIVGVTVFVSSGDGGSGNPAQVLYPPSDPWVTGCGGVTISNVSGTTFTEVTWGGSGGGISNVFPKPAWQSWVSVPTSVNPAGHVGRGVPDISGDADPASGYMLILNGASTGPWGGTSAVAPFYAGLVAVMNANLDEPVGFLNQSLYAFNGTSVYRDVTVGSNGLYSAHVGWDACTGLGSVFGTAMVTALQGVGLRGIVDVGVNADGRLEAFATGTDLALWHIWQAPGGGWSSWASLGGILTSNRGVGRNLDGRLEVFVRGTDDAVWHIWQTSPGGAWSAWASLGGVITSDPYVVRNQDGRLEVFARGTDKALWHIWQTAPNNGWSGWASLGGIITTDPIATQNNDGRIEVFARGTDNALWHIWQTSPGGAWSGWASLGGIITSIPSIFRNADGRLEAFLRGTDNALWHIWQTTPGGAWSGWASLGGVITSDAFASRNADGRLEVFARGTDNALWHIWQTAPNGGWSGWASLGGIITSDPTVAQNGDGRMEVFARGTDNALWHIWQTAPSNGWSAWASLGGIIVAEMAVHA